MRDDLSKWIESITRSDGGLHQTAEWVSWYPADGLGNVSLDGHFSVVELKAIIAYIESKCGAK